MAKRIQAFGSIAVLAAAFAVGYGHENAKPSQASDRQRAVLLLTRFSHPARDLAAMTLGWMCREAGVEFDVYYAAYHGTGGLFVPHGSTVIGGHHVARLTRALATFDTTVVRLGDVAIFDSVVRRAASKRIDCSGVHWQRYYVSPHIMELLHVPVEEGGMLGLVEPVLHSAGPGIMWEAAGDAINRVKPPLLC